MFDRLTYKLGYLYLRVQNGARAFLEREQGEAGLSKLAITVILLAVAVGLTLAVIAIIAPEILGLAQRTGDQIDSVPLEWGD